MKFNLKNGCHIPGAVLKHYRDKSLVYVFLERCVQRDLTNWNCQCLSVHQLRTVFGSAGSIYPLVSGKLTLLLQKRITSPHSWSQIFTDFWALPLYSDCTNWNVSLVCVSPLIKLEKASSNIFLLKYVQSPV
jgi:hypothetical protein